MVQRDQVQRDEILARLAQSRAELRTLLDPPSQSAAGGSSGAANEFPRSRTMRMLMTGRGLGVVGAILGGLFITRPTLAWRLIRLLPTSAVARMFLVRAVAAMRDKAP
jgi:hypothetical protein